MNSARPGLLCALLCSGYLKEWSVSGGQSSSRGVKNLTVVDIADLVS